MNHRARQPPAAVSRPAQFRHTAGRAGVLTPSLTTHHPHRRELP
jgi:hypothetical protein